MALDIEPIHQPQRAKSLLVKLPCNKSPGLITKLFNSLFDQSLIVCAILVHLLLLKKAALGAKANGNEAEPKITFNSQLITKRI
jgi:hypothetical protein